MRQFSSFRSTVQVLILAALLHLLPGCELYLKKKYTVHVFEHATGMPAPGVKVEAKYTSMSVLGVDPVVAYTDELGRAQMKIPDTDSILFKTNGYLSGNLDNTIRKEGGWRGLGGDDPYFAYIHRGWAEYRPDVQEVRELQQRFSDEN